MALGRVSVNISNLQRNTDYNPDLQSLPELECDGSNVGGVGNNQSPS